MTSEPKQLVGMVGLYDQPGDLLQAAAAVREAGFRRWDCFSPFPVHGIERAMGLGTSPVPRICLTVGFAGAGLAMLMQWWMSAVDFPIRVGGKPLFSWPAFVPITFELFVLFTALATFGCLILFCRLGRWHSPLHDSGIMPEITRDRFAVVLEATDEQFTEPSARQLLERTGCTDIRPLFELPEADESWI